MSPTEFLQKILPETGFYVLAEFRRGLGRAPEHSVHESPASLCWKACVLDNDSISVFHACASYRERRTEKMRVVENVLATRSQWLDIDVGPNKDYPMRRDAIRSLATACKTLGVPIPMLISSGRGIHAYWCFTRDLDHDEALQMGQVTSAALQAIGFAHDTTRTADLASILRPIGTHWRKEGKVEVQLIRDADPIDPATLLDPMLEHAPTALPTTPSSETDDEWGTGPRDFPPSSARQVIEFCGAMKAIAVCGGDVEEPAWRAMLGVVKHCVEGDELAHEWSRGHADYDAAQTQEKLDRWGTGPTTCAQFAKVSEACATCPQKVKSPIQLGHCEPNPSEATDAADAPSPATKGIAVTNLLDYAELLPDALPFWPKGYRWDGAFLSRLLPGADGEPPVWVNFATHLFYPYMRYRQSDNSWSCMCCALIHPESGRWRHFEIDAQCVSDNAPLASALAAFEIFSVGKGGKELTRHYLQDMLRTMKAKQIETAMYENFGWHDRGMVMGNVRITEAGRLPVLLSDRVPEAMRRDFGQGGSAEQWAEIIDEVYNRPGAEPFQFVICAAFGAPLVKLNRTDMWHGIPIALTGAGGLGKTTTCKVACSIYGEPQHFSVNANEDGSTINALFARVALMRNLPIVLDEITGREPRQLQGMLYALSAGQPKLRLQADGAPIDAGLTWDTVSFVTGNESIMNLLSRLEGASAEATQMRCFEIALPARYSESVFRGVNAKQRLEHELLGEQYGVVGDAYLRHVIKHRVTVSKMLQKARASIIPGDIETQRERYFLDLIATTLVGGMIARKMGFIQFDLNAMKAWAMHNVHTLRAERHAGKLTAPDYFHAFVTSLVGRTVITDRYGDGRARTEYIDERTLRDPVARLALKDRVFLVTAKYFAEWCREQRVAPRGLRAELSDLGYIRQSVGDEDRHRLFKGTSVAGGQVRCIEFNFDMIDNTRSDIKLALVPDAQQSGAVTQ